MHTFAYIFIYFYITETNILNRNKLADEETPYKSTRFI